MAVRELGGEVLEIKALEAQVPWPCPLALRLIGNEAPYIILGSGVAPSIRHYCRSHVMLAPMISVLLGFIAYAFTSRWGLEVGIVGGILGAATGLLLGIALLAALPIMSYSSRGSMLETKFHAFASVLASVLAGGTSVGEAIRSLSLYANDLKEFAVEINYANELLALGVAPENIFNELSRLTPSLNLKLLFRSLSRGVSAGSDLSSITRQHLEEYSNYYFTLIDKVSNSIGVLLEIFMVVGLLAPITVSIIAMLFSIYPTAGLSATEITFLMTFFLVPLVSLITVILVDNQASKLKL